MLRRSLTISEIRVEGTRRARARAWAEIPFGTMNSSRKISPGCIGGGRRLGSRTIAIFSPLVIINNLDIVRSAFDPSKANSILVIDPDAVLPSPITFQSFKAIARRLSQIIQPLRVVQHLKLPTRYREYRREAATATVQKQSFRFLIFEGLDHAYTVSRWTPSVQRSSCSYA